MAMSQRIHENLMPLVTMADGTIKQINPFSGTEVWTVPGRGNRPLAVPKVNPEPLAGDAHTNTCAFCSDQLLATPPEKARMVMQDGYWRIMHDVAPAELFATIPQFRRVPNLFEIVTYQYWVDNYGFQMSAEQKARMAAYLACSEGKAHVLKIVETKLKAAGTSAEDLAALDEAQLLSAGKAFFAGGHDVIIARRHFVDGATDNSQLASSGTLTVDEHNAFIQFTIDGMKELYRQNRYAPYVAVFQNWLRPAGASFDHLHKQLVAIDQRGVQSNLEIERLRKNPNMYNEWAVDYAGYHNLVICENDFAVAFAGFGHRYPTIEIYSKSAVSEPWLQSAEEIAGMSDLIHAIHAATGPEVPCNEEWHHKPIDLDLPMPWRVRIKWRVSTLAGFEGGTEIYLNTLSPQTIRDRLVKSLFDLRDDGMIAPTIRIATECKVERNSLKYNPYLR